MMKVNVGPADLQMLFDHRHLKGELNSAMS
jgi:hypothetical protein